MALDTSQFTQLTDEEPKPSVLGQTAQSYDATLRDVQSPDLVANQMSDLLQSDSPYLTAARTSAAQTAASRGLLNSSMAAGAGELAAIQSALPIAQQDANTSFQQGLTNQGYLNQASQTNAAAQNQLGLLGAQDTATKEQMALQQGYTLEQMDQQQLNDLQKLATQQGYTLEQMATQQGYTLEQVRQAQANNLATLAVQQGYSLEQMASQQGYTLEQLAASQGYTLEQMKQEHLYNVADAALQQGYSLEQLAAQQGYTLEQMAQQQGYTMEEMAQAQLYSLASMAAQQGYSLEQMAAQQGYTLEQMAEQFGYNIDTLQQEFANQKALATLNNDFNVGMANLQFSQQQSLALLDEQIQTRLANVAQGYAVELESLKQEYSLMENQDTAVSTMYADALKSIGVLLQNENLSGDQMNNGVGAIVANLQAGLEFLTGATQTPSTIDYSGTVNSAGGLPTVELFTTITGTGTETNPYELTRQKVFTSSTNLQPALDEYYATRSTILTNGGTQISESGGVYVFRMPDGKYVRLTKPKLA